MKTLEQLQQSAEETIYIWGYDTQRELFRDISTGRAGLQWVDVYNDIETLEDEEIKQFAYNCRAIDMNNISDEDVKNLTTLVWASMMAYGINF